MNIIRMVGCCFFTVHAKHLRARQPVAKRLTDIPEYIIIFPYNLGARSDFDERLSDFCTKRHINRLKKNIVGKLHIISLTNDNSSLACDCCNKTHHIADFFKPYTLLIKLPKENMFVSEEEWKNHYLKSQMTELIDIFMYLGASEVSFTVINTSNNKTEDGVSANLAEYGINVGVDLEVKHEEQGQDYITGKIIFNNPQINVNILFDADRFHYLPMKFDWQHMIEQRLQSGISSYKIKSFAQDYVEMTRAARISLHKIGIGVRTNKSTSNNVMIDMSVLFCDLIPNEFVKNSVPLLQERWSPNYGQSSSQLSFDIESGNLTILKAPSNSKDSLPKIPEETNIIKYEIPEVEDKELENLQSHPVSVTSSMES